MKNDFIHLIETELLKKAVLESKKSHNPIVVKNMPAGWKCVGVGNYAAVFMHYTEPDLVVKINAVGAENLKKEAEIYRKINKHPAYSYLVHQGPSYLILKRLEGITLYNAFAKGVKIPEKVIDDINEALDYARSRGLNPYDIHGKNVMMKDGRGYVVDVSDFYKEGKDEKWEDFVQAYYKLYKKTLYKFPMKIPFRALDFIRYGYRFYKKMKCKLSKIN
ncbi:serine/threonine protein kinase [Niallia sp. NCCP-28]|uniref:serine/threonine protein kinase n=1 Tax=Niallia sp. NCCP-28 TaxID=2934712 RepID=UPI0020812A55|nr:serine/threonine protein kinase [Niallia sp. NCCP-28]GKU82982.1 serine/threonine protein kinase [Niallia sp. NCCP-28]